MAKKKVNHNIGKTGFGSFFTFGANISNLKKGNRKKANARRKREKDSFAKLLGL